MKRITAVLLILLMLTGAFPLSSTLAAPDPSPIGEFNSVQLTGARAVTYHDGYIYAAQRDNPGGIYRIDIHTGLVTKVLELNKIMSVALNQAGDLFYTIDSNRAVIKKIANRDLTSLPLSSSTVAAVSTNYYATNLSYVYGMSFDAEDNLYFTDYTSKGIYKFTQGQGQATKILDHFSTPLYGLSVGPSGNLYIVGENDLHLYMVNANGSQITKKSFSPIASLNSIVFLPNGKAYLALSNNIMAAPEYNDSHAPFTEKPVISLNGSMELLVKYGAEFADPGATVTDNVDTGLTTEVTCTKDGSSVTGIDTTVPSTYYIHYNAEDAAGNIATEVIEEALQTP
ncbi:immunoglobulin-like domain-containing protein [Paenibacillus radicis (ex Gao et al. 2016)]|uniref:Pesticidal crystal protein Cry22Aa Ig-like domain-containing protein n=1 Tax=Paenibacillus radicis (ex Gao et al. 2016) TaxID=1737354 RepID=A0A917GZZ2_9BACL|nr:immunoglobulin-like domain-containing protein [Paenibacillus radicis (ex Gao et al. 2016)]GGG63059.1 hypothetical protein GCM10010918_16150 [Paenibacillus radicis (ex Gao et al. 2016)]